MATRGSASALLLDNQRRSHGLSAMYEFRTSWACERRPSFSSSSLVLRNVRKSTHSIGMLDLITPGIIVRSSAIRFLFPPAYFHLIPPHFNISGRHDEGSGRVITSKIILSPHCPPSRKVRPPQRGKPRSSTITMQAPAGRGGRGRGVSNLPAWMTQGRGGGGPAPAPAPAPGPGGLQEYNSPPPQQQQQPPPQEVSYGCARGRG